MPAPDQGSKGLTGTIEPNQTIANSGPLPGCSERRWPSSPKPEDPWVGRRAPVLPSPRERIDTYQSPISFKTRRFTLLIDRYTFGRPTRLP